MFNKGTLSRLLPAFALCTLMLSGCEPITEIPPQPEQSGNTVSGDDAAEGDNYVYSQLTDKEKEYFDIIKEAAARTVLRLFSPRR